MAARARKLRRDVSEEIVDRLDADRREHRGDVLRRVRAVPTHFGCSLATNAR